MIIFILGQINYLTLKAPGGGIFTCSATFFVLVVTEVVLGANDPIVN